MKKTLTILLIAFGVMCFGQTSLPPIKISANKRFFVTGNNEPFFWLGDTGWLLFEKCKKEEAINYLDKRQSQGFNVIQVMLLHDLRATDAYGDSALSEMNASKPKVLNGTAAGYDYWMNVDFIINEAAKRKMYIALVPVWGGVVKSDKLSKQQAVAYATFLAKRFGRHSNIIWIDGGDIKGSDHLDTWNAIGQTLKAIDPVHLITFHPRGRSSSSEWFHHESWLDFNMFQSGHKDYAQDTTEPRIGEDNWKFASADYAMVPTKPTMDGEPSYEGIPHGLHDSTQPYWNADDVRRYAYWSVFAGGCGFTYGNNAVMQFYSSNDKGASFFPKMTWQEAVNAPGASQMQYLKKLMLSRTYFDRMPNQSLITDNGEKYERVLATSGKSYALFYTSNGRSFSINTHQLKFKPAKASWFNPKDGQQASIKKYNSGVTTFDPPGEKKNGNDWVLILEKN